MPARVDSFGDELPLPFLSAVGSGRWRFSNVFDVLAVSPDGARVLGAGNGGARVFEVATGRLLAELDVRFCRCAAWSRESDRVVVGTSAGHHVWSVSGAQHFLPGPEQLALASGPSHLRAVVRMPGGLIVRDLAEDPELLRLEGDFQAAALSADGSLLARARKQGNVQVYDVATGALRCTAQCPPTWTQQVMHVNFWAEVEDRVETNPLVIHSLVFSSGLLAVLGDDGVARTFDLDTGEQRHAFERAGGRLAFSADATLLASGRRGELAAAVWSLGEAAPRVLLARGAVSAVAFASDRLLGASNFGLVERWRAPAFEVEEPGGDGLPGSPIALARVGRRLAVRGHGALVVLDRGEVIARWPVSCPDDGLALHPGKREAWAVTGIDPQSAKRVLCKLTEEGAQEIARLPAQSFSLAFSPDGARVACAAYRSPVRVWTAKGAPAQTIDVENARRVCFSPDSATLAIGTGDGRVHLVGGAEPRVLSTDREANTHTPNNDVSAMAFSRDGSRLITAWNEVVRVWDVAGGVVQLQSESLGRWSRALDVAFTVEGEPRALFVGERPRGVTRYDAWSPAGFVPLCGSPPAAPSWCARGVFVPGGASVLLVLSDLRVGEAPWPVAEPPGVALLEELLSALARVGDANDARDRGHAQEAERLTGEAASRVRAAWARDPQALAALLPGLAAELAAGATGAFAWSQHSAQIDAALRALRG